MIHPAFFLERSIFRQDYIPNSILETDPGVDDGPAPLIVKWTKMIIEIFSIMTVISDKQSRACRDFRVVIEKVRKLCCIDGFKTLFLQVAHHLFEFRGENIVWVVQRILVDAVKHNNHDDGARRSVV